MENPSSFPHFSPPVRPGIEALPPDPLRRATRIGLVAHPASLTSAGIHSADYLLHDLHLPLAALFGPEHGFFGRAAAGETVVSGLHPRWNLPIHSLYGATRAPTDAMLAGLDLLIFDLQTLACRAYTYVSTLRLVMEACAARRIPLVVADRSDPLMLTPPDGPMLQPAHSSFVALVPTPFHYGLTIGEIARYLKAALPLPDLELHVAPVQGLSRRPPDGTTPLRHLQTLFPAPFPCPSPAIQSLQSALCFPAMVFLEALPHLSHARASSYAFQYLSAPDHDLFRELPPLLPPLPGIELTPTQDPATSRPGLHIAVTDPVRYRPAATVRALLRALETIYAADGLWHTPGARPEWLLKLWGAPIDAPDAPFLPPLLY